MHFLMPFLRDPRTFNKDSGSSSSSDSGSSSSSDDKPAPKTIGQVSKTGQYAGDGFEFVENEGGYLTRTYTGAGKDNGLGTDVFHAPTSGDDNVKNAVAQISLNEGSEFAGTAASATDGNLLNLVTQGDTGSSDSYAAQVGVENYTPTITYGGGGGDDTPAPVAQAMEEEESFGDAFARNRAAGADTFTYKGNLYTTDLAPSTPAPAAPTVSYDAFGNQYSTPQAAAEADQTMAQQSATANQAVSGTEESLFEQPVVSESAQDYLDSLGTDFDFGQFDTPGIDYTVSQGEAGRGGPDSAAPGFSYELPGVVDTSAKDADLSFGVTPSGPDYVKPGLTEDAVTFTGTDVDTRTNPRLGYESGQDVLQSSADYLTGLDGSGPNTTGQVDDSFYGGAGAPVIPAVAIQDAAAGYTGADVASDLYRNITSGAAEEAKQTVGGAGTVFDEAAEAVINSPAVLSKVFEQAFDPYAPYSQYGYTRDPIEELMGYNAGQIDPRLANAAIAARDTYYDTDLIPRSQVTAGSEFVAPLKQYLGDVQASQAAKISPEMQKRQQDALPAAGTTIDDIINGRAKDRLGRPYGTDLLATGMTGAQESVDLLTDALATVYLPARVGGAVVMGTSGLAAGESGFEDAEQMIDADFASGKLQQTPQFEQMVSVYGDEQAALAALKDKAGQRALVTAGPTGALGDYLGAKALTTVSPGFANPFARAVTSPVIGGITEGTEKGLTNISARSAGADVARGQDVGTNFLLGLAGDATISTPTAVGQGIAGLAQPVGPNVAPTVDSKTYVPPAQTTGQIAQVPAGVQTAYEEAAKTMEEAGVRGVGDTGAAADRLTAAEELMMTQLEERRMIKPDKIKDIAEETGLTLNEAQEAADRAIDRKMNEDYQMLQGLADESVLETGGLSEELVEEINARMTDVNAPEKAAEIIDNALNRPFVSNEGKTRMEIMAENAKKAGQDSVTAKPATGIETALGANTGLDIKTDSGLDSEQQLEFLLEDGDSQQLNLLDSDSSEDATTGEDAATGTDTTAGTDSTTKTDVGTDSTTKTDVGTDTATDTTTDVLTTVDVPEEDEDDDDEVEVEVDDDTTTTTTDDDDGLDVIVPPIVTTDEDGNTVTECPEGYTMIETANGPMCQKTVTAQRQRAGRGVQAYTGIVTKPGARGPGQRRITTTRTERVRPTTRSV